MASTYKVEISAKAARSVQSAGGGWTPAQLRQQAQDGKAPTSPGGREPAIQKQSRIFEQMLKQSQNQTKELVLIRRRLDKMGGLGGGGGGGPGGAGPMSSGSAAGIGAIGASIPMAGAVIGMLGYGISQIFKIGEAYIQKAAEQLPTAGVSGFRRSSFGMMSAAETGQYIAARRKATGSFTEGEGEYTGGEDYLSQRVKNIFGISAEEMGKQVGVFGGEQQYTSAAKSLMSKTGMTTQLPELMGLVASELEEAVKNGVDSSGLGDTMTAAIGSVYQFTRSGDAGLAMRAVQDARQTGKNVVAGDYGSMSSYRQLQIGASKEFINRDENKSYLKDKFGFTDEDFNNLTAEKRVFAARALAQDPAIQMKMDAEMMKGMVGDFGKGATDADKMSAVSNAMKQIMPERSSDPEYVRAVMLAMNGETGQLAAKGKWAAPTTKGMKSEDVDIQMKAQEAKMGDVKDLTIRENRNADMLMAKGGPGEAAANTVMTANEAFLSVAKELTTVVTPAINIFNDALRGSADIMVKTITDIKDLTGSDNSKRGKAALSLGTRWATMGLSDVFSRE